MTKFNPKYSEALALIFVIALAPLSIAFAQTTATEPSTGTTDTGDTGATGATGTDGTTDDKTDTRTDEQKRKDKLRDELKRIKDAIAEKKRTEKIRDSDRVRDADTDRRDKVTDKVRDRVTDRIADRITDKVRDRVIDRADKGAELSYSGKTSGWAILGGTAFPSSIGISGEGYHQGGGNWKMTAVGDIAVADHTAKIDLVGHVRGHTINLQGMGTLSDGTEFKLHLKGHYAPTGNTNEFAIAFTNSGIQFKDQSARMPLMQVGTVIATPIVTPAPVPEPAPEPVPIAPAQ